MCLQCGSIGHETREMIRRGKEEINFFVCVCLQDRISLLRFGCPRTRSCRPAWPQTHRGPPCLSLPHGEIEEVHHHHPTKR